MLLLVFIAKFRQKTVVCAHLQSNCTPCISRANLFFVLPTATPPFAYTYLLRLKRPSQSLGINQNAQNSHLLLFPFLVSRTCYVLIGLKLGTWTKISRISFILVPVWNKMFNFGSGFDLFFGIKMMILSQFSQNLGFQK